MGLRAIWLIWCSPCTLVTVRVVVPAHASPEITWPEDLKEGDETRATEELQGAVGSRLAQLAPTLRKGPGSIPVLLATSLSFWINKSSVPQAARVYA